MRRNAVVLAALAALAALGASGCRGGSASDAASDDARAPADPAAEILAATTACDATVAPARGREASLRVLRAWLDGAELPPSAGVATEPRPAIDAALTARGRELFAAACATCHGERGAGDGPTGRQLERRPADLASGVLALRSTESGELPTDDDLFATISRGVHGTGMPPWLLLPERDRWALVAYVKTLSPAFADDEAPPPIAIDAPPAVTAERIARGDELFHGGGCSSCHGDRGRGDGPAAASLHLASGAPVRPRDLAGARFHRGSDVRAIFQTITTGLDGTPMASFARVMSPDDRWAVAAYVHGLAPPFTDGPGGLRCPRAPSRDPQELVGLRSELHALPR